MITVLSGLHVYAQGGNAFGMQKKGLTVETWMERFYEWIISTGS